MAGAAVGAQAGRRSHNSDDSTQDVQRCRDTSEREPIDHWDVSYEYRGIVHHMQTTSPPGTTVTVNADGEPRE